MLTSVSASASPPLPTETRPRTTPPGERDVVVLAAVATLAAAPSAIGGRVVTARPHPQIVLPRAATASTGRGRHRLVGR